MSRRPPVTISAPVWPSEFERSSRVRTSARTGMFLSPAYRASRA
jgi:hypothetical protein